MERKSQTGLLVLQGNRLELLADAVFAWLAANPLAPLEEETILVQSNGMAEWFKMRAAQAHGVCASTTLELPARFVWRAYRAVLGHDAVPSSSSLDKLPLTWRLMSMLPDLANQPVFAPVRAFLGDGSAGRRLQLAQRLADLFDQYQIYRSDWLRDWSRGVDDLRNPRLALSAAADSMPADQRWQAALWRAVVASLQTQDHGSTRSGLHLQFLDALQNSSSGQARAFPRLPRRVVLFGTTHMPLQTLEALAGLAAHCQVLMAVPNPCRFHWADLIEGRELLHFERRRLALPKGRDLSPVPLQDMHAHGHPLLAAWGRQSRDFVRQLDAFDDAQAAGQRFAVPRVDFFDEAPGNTLLQQVQAAVRDLLPVAEHPKQGVQDADRSIVFHVAHSAQREVEVLHDQLLRLLAPQPDVEPLNPRDIVVMVPDIDFFAPAIRSVFGQHGRWDPRHIPWGIGDQQQRGHQPLLVALEWLLRAPSERFGASQVRDLLDVPAVSRRFGIDADDLPQLMQWIDGAGIRWGLNAAQRESLGLGASGDQNTWAFGLRRMLLGYASGEMPSAEGFAGSEPNAEVAGLAAGLAGSVAELLRTLTTWWTDALALRTPAAWAEHLRSLMEAMFLSGEDEEREVLAAAHHALAQWLQACEVAGFDGVVDIAVVRDAWMNAIDEPGLARRFRAGGVTFCTLLPLRAIPFEVVCLLGMNDGDYPRRSSRADFDLMSLPGQARPGDRSRRDDDRQLMLDALLSARRVLYISWAGRSQRDNQEQPPSVLVSQLRDYLAAGWGPGVLGPRTTEHPLQPFSRRYFESAGPSAGGSKGDVFTYATEWRAAHLETAALPSAQDIAAVSLPGDAALPPMTVLSLADFLRNPVKQFFRQRLQVVFGELDAASEDDEPFSSEGLAHWACVDTLLRACRSEFRSPPAMPPTAQVHDFLRREVARLRRAGQLPIGGPGQQVEAGLLQAVGPMVDTWLAVRAQHPVPIGQMQLRLPHPDLSGLVFGDVLPNLCAPAAGMQPVWIDLQASKVADFGKRAGTPKLRGHMLLAAWVRCLASAACGRPAAGIVIGEGALVRVKAFEVDQALPVLLDLMAACREGLHGDGPLPTAVKTGMAWLSNPASANAVYEGAAGRPGEVDEPCLARLYPDFESLAAQAGFEAVTKRLYAPFQDWLAEHVSMERLSIDAPAVQAAGDE